MIKLDKSKILERYSKGLPYDSGLSLAVWGKDKAGKSHFAATSHIVGHVFYHDIDLGFHRVASKFKKTKGNNEIYVARYGPKAIDLKAEHCQQSMDEFIDNIQCVIQDKSIRDGTVVIDNANTLWMWVQKIKLDELKSKRAERGKSLYGFDYADANLFYMNIINTIKSSGLNLILVNNAKQLYDGSGKALNMWEMQSNPKVPGAVDGVIFISHDIRTGDRHAKIELNGINTENTDKDVLRPTFAKVREFFK